MNREEVGMEVAHFSRSIDELLSDAQFLHPKGRSTAHGNTTSSSAAPLYLGARELNLDLPTAEIARAFRACHHGR